MSGQIVHFEIPADDTASGRSFWGPLSGGSSRRPPGPFEHHMTRTGEQTGGAITDMEPGKQGIRVYWWSRTQTSAGRPLPS
jgi:predicted enzyme related to lactoylglutathione lyase